MTTRFIDKSHGDSKNTKRKTEFLYFVSRYGNHAVVASAGNNPKYFETVELVCRGSRSNELDIMIATHKDGYRNLYLGHWNDGCL